VSIVFGADDPYLNPRVACRFAGLFPRARLELVEGARHYVQVDEPQRVAGAVLGAAQTGSTQPDPERAPGP
jgi:haloalkane dehalogenase